MSETEISAAIAASLILGGIIVKLTPTKKDDEWWRKIKRLLGKG